MAVALLGNELALAARQGYPSDGSKKLPRHVERLCALLAAGSHTYQQAADALRVSEATVYRATRNPLCRARIAFLKDQLTADAYAAEPLVDKRNRVVMAGALARTLHAEGERQGWRDTVAVTKQGEAITGFDWRRTDQLRQLLDYLAKEVGDRTPAGTGAAGSTTNVGVSLSLDDAVLRVQALFSRVDGASAQQGEPPMALPTGVEGGTGVEYSETTTARLATEYKNPSHAGDADAPIEGEWRERE